MVALREAKRIEHKPAVRPAGLLALVAAVVAAACAASLIGGISAHVVGASSAANALATCGWVVVVTAAAGLTSRSRLGAAVMGIASLGAALLGVEQRLPWVSLIALGICLLFALQSALLGRERPTDRPGRDIMSRYSLPSAVPTTLGAGLAVTMLALRPGDSASAPAVALVVTVSLPLADAVICLAGRVLHRQPLLADGADHIVDRLARLGLPAQLAGAGWLAAGVAATIAGFWFAAVPPGRVAILAVAAVAAAVWLLLLAVPVYGDSLDRLVVERLGGKARGLACAARRILRIPPLARESTEQADADPVVRGTRPPGLPRRLYRDVERRVRQAEPALPVGPLAFWVGAAAATATLCTAFLTLWFFERNPWGFDDLGLFNAAYLFARSGTVGLPTAPYGGTLHSMYALPPTHYFILGLLMLMTRLPAEAAAVIPIVCWMALGALAVVVARWELPWKLGALAGLYAGLVYWAPQAYIRPDADMAGALIAGLLLLEAGRSRDFDWRLLLLGSFALTLASSLHYVATPAFLGVGVYAAWAWLRLGRGALRPLMAIAAGALVVGLPYLVLFVIPDIRDISAIIQAANGGLNPVAALRAHIAYYRAAGAAGQGGTLLHYLTLPLTWSGIPAVLLTTPLLWWRKETRGVALASLPFLLFVLLVLRVPVAEGEIHMTPEITLYLICLFAAAALGIDALARWALSRLRRPKVARAAVRHLMVGVAGIALIWPVTAAGRTYLDAASGTPTWHPLHDEMGLARAAGFSIVGPRAVETSSNYSLWYISGASAWFDGIANLDVTDPSALDVRAYARRFTALPEGNVGTTAGLELEQGVLGVAGFYLDRNDPSMDYVLGEARAPRVPVGYIRDGLSLRKVQFAPQGAYRFVVARCADASAKSVSSRTSVGAQAEFVTYLPAEPGVTGWGPVKGGRALVTFVTSSGLLRTWRSGGDLSGCKLLYDVPMSERKTDSAALIARERLAGSSRTIRFLQAPRALDALYSPGGPLRPVGGLAIGPSDAVGNGRVTQARKSWLITTSDAMWSEALQAPIPSQDLRARPGGQDTGSSGASGASRVSSAAPSATGPAPHWLEVSGTVRSGNPGLCILDLKNKTCLIRRQLARSLPGPYYLPIPPSPDPVALYIDNEGRGPARLLIRSIQVLAAVG